VKRQLIVLAVAVALAGCGSGGPGTFHTNDPTQALAKFKADWSCEIDAGSGWRAIDRENLESYVRLEERGVDPAVLKVKFRCTEDRES
jgi:hypothetical protein